MEPYSPATIYSDLPQVPKLPTRAHLSEVERTPAAMFREVLRAEPLGQWGSDRWAQVQRYTGPVYIAIKPVLGLWRAASYTLHKRIKPRRDKTTFGPGQAVAKSMPGPQSRLDDEYVPFEDEDHPLVSRLHCPNPTETFGEMAAKMCLQFKLTGVAPLWCIPNDQNKPVEFWSLKTPFLYPVYQVSKQYPRGAWRVNPSMPQGWSGILPSGLGPSGAILPGEEVKRFMDPHPWMDWEGYGAVQAGAVQLDVLMAIDEARKNAMDRGVTLDTYVVIPGADQATLDRMVSEMRQKHAGSKNHRSFGAFGTSSPDSKATFQTANARVIDMDFPEGWEQMTKFALSLFRVPPIVAGLTAVESYAAGYAARQQFRDEQQDDLTSFGLFLTESLAWPWSSFPGEYVIKADAGKAENLELQEEQLQFDVQQDGITHNEYRVLRNRKPVPDGDVPHSVYLAAQQQAIAPQPQPGMDGDPNAMQQPQPGEEEQPQDAAGLASSITDEALNVLGVPSGDGAEGETDTAGAPVDTEPQYGKAMPGSHPWDESKHKRDHGKFSSTGGGGKAPTGGASIAGKRFTPAQQSMINRQVASNQKYAQMERRQAQERADDRSGAPAPNTDKQDLDSVAEMLKNGKNAVVLLDGKGRPHKIRNGDDVREFIKAGGRLPANIGDAQARQKPPPLPGQSRPTPPPLPGSPQRPGPPPLPQSPQYNTPPKTRQEHQQRVRQAAPRVAEMAGNIPDGANVLASAGQWASKAADMHADRVAAHLGISREAAHHLVRTTIEHLCHVAAGINKTGASQKTVRGASGRSLRFKVGGGGKLNTSGDVKQSNRERGGPPRQKNDAGKGSLPPRPGVRKALDGMNEMCGSAGGFLVQPGRTTGKGKKRKRKMVSSASILKGL